MDQKLPSADANEAVPAEMSEKLKLETNSETKQLAAGGVPHA